MLSRSRCWLGWLAAIALLTACGGEAPAASTVRFAPGDGPVAFADVPFPSELYRDADGRIALGGFPNPNDGGPMFAALRELLAARSGFCATCNVTFTIDGGLQPESLPSDAVLQAGPGFDDGIALVDIDARSPERGRTFPLRLQWDVQRGWLSLRPARGEALAGGRRYAAVLTTALLGADGSRLAPAPAFAARRDADDAVLAEPLAALEDLGLTRDRIAGLSWFTTETAVEDLLALREAVSDAATPTMEIDEVWSGSAIDELLGTPATPAAGIDREPAAGTEGTRAVAHDTTALIVAGRFRAPRFVAGSGVDVGTLARSADGAPLGSSDEEVPFVLIVPAGVDLSSLPVVVSHHGFNASRVTGFALADTAGRAGYAVLAIDAYQHGDRAASARDDVNAMRGTEMSDGFAETTPLDVSSRVFGLSGGAQGMELFPGYPLAAFEQFAADAMSAVRLVRESDLSALRAADPSLASLSFDAQRIAFVGNSMGAVVGVCVAVAEPSVGAFVLDVMPGSIIETLAESGEFRPLTEGLLLPMVGVREDYDERTRAMLFDPTVDLMRWVMEPVDPLALARHLHADRRVDTTPDVLIQLAGHDEVAAPTASQSVVGAAHIPAVGDFRLAPVATTSLPLPAGEPAVAAVRFEGAMHGMLEVNTQSSSFSEPLVPPLAPRPAPVVVVNPTQRVHDQIETFLKSYAEEGRARIVE